MRIDTSYILKTMLESMSDEIILYVKNKKVDISVIDNKIDFKIKLSRKDLIFEIKFIDNEPIVYFNGNTYNLGLIDHWISVKGKKYISSDFYIKLLNNLREKYNNDFNAMVMFSVICNVCSFNLSIAVDGHYSHHVFHELILENVSFKIMFSSERELHISWNKENDIIISNNAIYLNNYSLEKNKIYKLMEKL